MDGTEDGALIVPGDGEREAAVHEKTLRFTGSGAEYFRIWAVNLALTVLTLGLYGPWARVRRLQYFYRHTELDGAVFDYVVNPAAILFGRLLALALFVLYYLTFEYSIEAGVACSLGLALLLPYLLWQSIRFKARNTIYRGLSFGFEGRLGDAYRAYLPAILLALTPAALTAYFVDLKILFWIFGLSGLGLLAMPFFHALFRRYTQGNLRYGATGFQFSGRTQNFFNEWIVGMAIFLGAAFVVIAIGALVSMVVAVVITKSKLVAGLVGGVIALLIVLVSFLLVGPYFTAVFQNLVWNKTRIGDIGFRSDLKVMSLFSVQVWNTLMVIFTLGLYRPFAAIRVARCRLESISVIGAQHLGDFTAGAAQSRRGATGESAGEFFEMDVAL